MGKHLIKIIKLNIVVAYKAVHTLTYHTQTLLDNLLKALANRHDFTY